MKKAMKKLMAALLAVAMVCAMVVPAMAAEGATTPPTYKITAPATNHQYEIYQIFTGDVSNGILSNVKWGQNGTGAFGEAVDTSILEELTNANISSASDSAILSIVLKYVALSNPVATITNSGTYSALAGYYLIKDKDGSVTGNDAYTKYIVEVVENVTIAPKSAVPDFKKKLKDTNDTTGVTTDWQDSADYDIGDKVPFRLQGTVASNYDQYKTYYFAFHDVEESTLNFDASSVEVFLGDENGTKLTAGTDYELVTSPTDGCTFEVVFDDLKKVSGVVAGSKITVTYSSTLNENAKLGSEGNVNKAKLEFSNNPNNTQSGKPDTGETPWDNVIVFTYQVVVNKYANTISDDTKLPGAEFTLSKKLKDGTTKDIAVVKSTDGTSFTFKGLDDGDYILTETKTPTNYNTIEPITFTVTANHDIEWTTQGRTNILTSLTGNTADGTLTFTANTDKSELSTGVINKSGTTLPGTGGIGTTIFYVIGGGLMVAAAVLLITKKRMENKN